MGLVGLLKMESFWAQWNLFDASNYSLRPLDRKEKEYLINIMHSL
jgi:hypothetical protein